ncbi:hypothetical protein PIB30_075341 [Stylosanthes scabra]|uniref:Uncharacterized protein n=1 Tax=Stylosanthes scabra TaxID=79078 RepID=A0ABU6UPB4_9FABA|nr:hypothetical protein [Stylosanthes scabra]
MGSDYEIIIIEPGKDGGFVPLTQSFPFCEDGGVVVPLTLRKGLSVTHERCNFLMTIASVTDAKVMASSPTTYDPCGGNAESTQKGGAGCFGNRDIRLCEAKMELMGERNERTSRTRALYSDDKLETTKARYNHP